MEYIEITSTPLEIIVSKTIQVLQRGGLVIFPTETTYGAGVDATNQAGVDKLLAYKSRREGKPLSIAVNSLQMAEPYVVLNQQAKQLAAQFLPGPITIVCQGKGAVAKGVESEFSTLGVRIPNYSLVLELISAYGKPITATSANGSGEKRPYSIKDIFDGLSERQKSLIDLVLDAGELPPNPPSTVIDTSLSTPVTLRTGEISLPDTGTAATTLLTNSEQETKDIAKRLLLKYWDKIKTCGLIIGLDGSLGTGKTIFAKGVAEFLQIKETITSPTYTYIQEYPFERHGVTGKLYHLDLWKIDNRPELDRLEIASLCTPQTVVVIEWIHQVWPWLEPVITTSGVEYLHLSFEQELEHRKILIHE